MTLDLRMASTRTGLRSHATGSANEPDRRTLCGRRVLHAVVPWVWEEFDEDWHCRRCWTAAERFKETT